ncbi:ubiquitin-like-specific protease 1A [Durio zibethinus]|uniref:Ubiquitin-like-specific protease 1A n=1 Tax=Durio zibethinus TaxID=66656 RepID=A0A6P5X4E0_DURZI|nr:ubiquitin-like-specific protease 1A [Durio zibethinus]
MVTISFCLSMQLFLPMCLHEHWLLFYADIDGKKLPWLDSNEHSQMSNVSEKHVILRWFLEFLLPSLGHDHKDWSYDVPKNIPMQKNSVDCALFVMKYADCLTHGNHFPFTQDDMPHFRHRTFLDLYHGSICVGGSQGY